MVRLPVTFVTGVHKRPGDDFAPHKPVSVSSRGRHFTLAYVKIFTYCGDSDFVDSATSKLMIRCSGQRAGEN
jgi:hypothetical protein